MRVKNLRTFAVYLPYAGLVNGKGWKLGPQCLSPELPTDRYYDPLLQRDWQRKTIELVFNAMDAATLGQAVTGMTTAVNPGIVAGAAPAPEPEAKAQDPAPKPAAPVLKAQDPAPQRQAMPARQPEPESEERAPIVEPITRIKTDAPAQPAPEGMVYCMACHKPRKKVTIYPPMKTPICRFCYRDRDRIGDWAAEMEGRIETPVPVEQAEPNPNLGTSEPTSVSLADISRQNAEIERQLMAGPLGSPLQSFAAMQAAGMTQPPKPNPQY